MEKSTWKCGDLDVEIWMGQWSMIPKQSYLRGMNTFVQLLDKRHWFMATKWSMRFLFETEPWWEVWTHLDGWYRLILTYAYSWPWYCEKNTCSIDVSYFFIPRFRVNNANGRHDLLWLLAAQDRCKNLKQEDKTKRRHLFVVAVHMHRNQLLDDKNQPTAVAQQD